MKHPPIGIDLGTTNSLIAVFEDGAPRLISNALGSPLTPSVVSELDGRLIVGETARDRLATNPRETAATFKRAMGTKSQFTVGKRQMAAEELSALVLRKLKADAEADLGQPVRDVVVSVPAYFNQGQRQATMDACRLAELNPVRLINEPTAAALAYGLQDRDAESRFLVFDLGGGTFDITVLDHFEGVMEVKASSGDAYLGGEDFTEALAKAMVEAGKLEWTDLTKDEQAQARQLADGAKRRLGVAETHDVTLRLKRGETGITLTREMFETACAPQMRRLRRPIERCFYDSDLAANEMDRIILVGGATRMPMIRQFVTRQFGMFPDSSIDPDQAVALGAAVQAALVARDAALDDVVMTDVSPFSVGIGTAERLHGDRIVDGLFTPLIERNTPLPASRERYFATMNDNQTGLKVEVYQGEAPKVSDNVLLGEFLVSVPRAPAGQEGMTLRLSYDSSGLIEVEATTKNDKGGLVIKQNAPGLTDAEIAKRLKAMEKLKEHPRDAEENIALLARIRRLYEMASGDDRTMLSHLMVQFEAVIADQDPQEIERVRGEISRQLDAIDDYYVS